MKIKNFSRSFVAALAWSAALILTLVLVAAVGVAQELADQALQVEQALAPETLRPGEAAAATLTVRNPSAKAITVEELTAQLGEGWVYVGQAAGSDVTVAARVEGASLHWPGPFALAAGEALTIRYWAIGPVAEAAVEQQPALARPAAAPRANGTVTATKTADPAMLEPGGAVAYTVVFENVGASDVGLTEIEDQLPAPFQYVGLAVGSEIVEEPVDTVEPEIVWQGLYTVSAGSTLTLRYWVWAPADAAPSFAPYTNTVMAVYSETLVGPAESGVVLIGPYVEVSKDASPAQVLVGEAVTYTVVLENNGNGAGVVDLISDTLPLGFQFLNMVPGSTISDTPDGITGTIVWQGPFTLPVGAALTLTYQAKASMASGLAAPVNQVVAVVNDMPTDPAEAAVQVDPRYVFLPLVLRDWRPATFEVTKQASGAQIFAGEIVTYTVTLDNIGSEAGKLDQVLDTLPQGFTFVGMAPDSDVGTNPAGTTGTLVWTGPFEVESGEALTLIYRVQVSDESGVYTNTVTATTIDAYPPKEPAGAPVEVTDPIYLQEDFESGTDNWEAFTNYWRLKPQQWYLQSTGGVNNSTSLRHTYWKGWETDPGRGAHDALYMYRGPGAENWTDYRMEGWVKMDLGSKMGFWVRGKYFLDVEGTHVEGYYIDWRPNVASGAVEVWRIKDSGGTAFHFSDPELIALGDATMHLGNWYHLAVEVEGDNIRVYVDGTQVINHFDDRWGSGTVGFFAYKVEYADWDNITVTPLD